MDGRALGLCAGVVLFAAGCGNNQTTSKNSGNNNNNNPNNSGNQQGTSGFTQTNLVSDNGGASHMDANLVNAWGLDRGPNTYWWASNNGTGTSTLYAGDGTPQSLVVAIPATGGTGAPTGVVFNGTTDFTVSANGPAAPALFIFVTEDGTILGWNPTVAPATAVMAADQSGAGANYKGVALGQMNGQNVLYVANFAAGTVDIFDTHFAPMTGMATGAFTDPEMPAGMAPFNVYNSGQTVYVSYAVQDEDKKDDVAGAGNGRLIAFDANGTLMKRFDLGQHANAPWGMTLAPTGFGNVGGMLLVGNFGDGHVYAVDPTSGAFMNDLTGADGASMVIEGLWALRFGNDGLAGSSNTLFFTAGPDDESHGLFGSIEATAQ